MTNLWDLRLADLVVRATFVREYADYEKRGNATVQNLRRFFISVSLQDAT